MEFIFSAFLWLLPLSATPLIFHLINSRKFKTIEFSSIYFINYLKSKAIRRMNIVNIFLLILRILIIATLILAISRPILKSSGAESLGDSSSTLLSIIIDDTFSSINKENQLFQIQKIKKGISSILEAYKKEKKNAHLEILSINKDLIFEGFLEDFQISKLSEVEGSYRSGNISNILSEYFDKKYSENFLNVDMYIFSDMEKSSIDVPLENNWWKINFVDISSEEKMPLISDIRIDGMVISNQSFEVEMEIWNNNNYELFDVVPNLLFDGDLLSKEKISIPPQSKRIISFNLNNKEKKVFKVIGYLTFSGESEKLVGNQYFTTVNTLPAKEICFYALEDFALAEHLKIAISAANPNVEIKVGCTEYDEIFSSDIVILDNFRLLDRENLISYAKNGGHIIVFPNSLETSPQIYLEELGIDILWSEEMIDVKKENIINDDIFKNVFKNMKENFLFSINEKYLLPINSETVIEIPGKGSLWNRVVKERGLIDIFGISLSKGENNDNAFAMRPALFISTMIYFLNSGTNSEDFFLGENIFDSKSINTDNFTILYTNKVDSKERKALDITDPGFYTIYSKEKDILKVIVSNVSLQEISGRKIDKKTLIERYENIAFIDTPSDLEDALSMRAQSSEVWHLFLALSILFLITESVLVNVIGKK